MSARAPVVGIDVGSSTVSVLVAVPDGNELHVLGCGQARHDGARKGVIANLSDVTEAVSTAADEAEAMATAPVELAAVGIGGVPVQGVRSTASVPVTGRDRTVTEEDQRRALAACAQFNLPPDYRVLDIIPCDFAVDGDPNHEGIPMWQPYTSASPAMMVFGLETYGAPPLETLRIWKERR